MSHDFTGITGILEHDEQKIKEAFDHCSDVHYRHILIGEDSPVQALLVWIDGLADKTSLQDDILKSLLHHSNDIHAGMIHQFNQVVDRLLSVGDVKNTSEFSKLVKSLCEGDTLLLVDGWTQAAAFGTKNKEGRKVGEPTTESVVRGPRQGFTETIRTNTTLIRKIIKSNLLKMDSYKIGDYTQTEIIVAYIDGLASKDVIEEVKRRLSVIDLESILESAYVEECIEDTPYSPFPQIAHTERPDKAAAELLEGKVLIMVDGTPFVLIVPCVLVQFIQSSEDYYERFPMALAVRILRFMFFFVALLLPAIYIAITTYHQEMIPTTLLISVAGDREGVPFPALVEALLMEVTFEALREAGVRLPKPVGQAISIVGALVIGEAAVQAGIVSSAMVIVVAVTAIASFVIPAFNIAISIRMLRFPLMAVASVLGLYGVMLGLLALLIHLCSLNSFGVPYLTPLAPSRRKGQDVLIRAPWWKMRQGNFMKKLYRRRGRA
ncbi:MAG: hypothetical protein K0S39_1743 [Paenibacillus sp.]|jgi:spore germination protein KA|nr:hypothetical protein [Paenibacillus sp.]